MPQTLCPPPGWLADRVFKIADATAWSAATAVGYFQGSADDARDGFIHLSAVHQLSGTLAKHFRNSPALVLVAFRTSDLGTALRWEPSRGGDLFPHLYAPLPTRLALWQKPLERSTDGVCVIDEGWFR